MDVSLITSMLDVVATEEAKRKEEVFKLSGEAAEDHWLSCEEPFLQELYLLVLVFLWHQIEKELICLAARVCHESRSGEMTLDEYSGEVLRLKKLGATERWKEIREKLKLDEVRDYALMHDILRNVANSYKHEPFDEPSESLLRNLKLDSNKNYARHAESGALREALCEKLDLSAGSRYHEIVGRFTVSSQRFFDDVKKKAPLRPLEQVVMDLRPSTFAH